MFVDRLESASACLELCSLGIIPRQKATCFAALEACHISHRDYIGQGRDGSDSGLRHQQESTCGCWRFAARPTA